MENSSFTPQELQYLKELRSRFAQQYQHGETLLDDARLGFLDWQVKHRKLTEGDLQENEPLHLVSSYEKFHGLYEAFLLQQHNGKIGQSFDTTLPGSHEVEITGLEQTFGDALIFTRTRGHTREQAIFCTNCIYIFSPSIGERKLVPHGPFPTEPAVQEVITQLMCSAQRYLEKAERQINGTFIDY